MFGRQITKLAGLDEHVPSGTAPAFFGRQTFRLDGEPGTGAAPPANGVAAVVEFPKVQFSEKPTMEEFKTFMGVYSERAKELATRQNRDEQEVVNLKAGFAEFGVALTEAKNKINGLTPMGHGGQRLESWVPQSGLGRLKPPDGMGKAHFNLLVATWDELACSASFGEEIQGVGRMSAGLLRMASIEGAEETRMRVLHQEFQRASDLIYLLDTMMFGKGGTEYAMIDPFRREVRIKHLKAYPEYARLEKEIRKAANTGIDTQTSGEGAEWIPSMFSANLIRQVQARLVIAQLFRRIPMPGPEYKVPLMGGDTKAFKMSEGLEEGATKVRAKTFATTNVTLSAKKIGTRMLASGEVLEDSIIPIQNIIVEQMALSLARGQDDMIYNGDTTATHMDADVIDSDDIRKVVNGVRYFIRGYAATYPGTTLDAMASPLKVRDLLKQRKYMKAHANPQRGVYVAGFGSVVELMLLQNSNGDEILITPNTYGPNAVIFNGEIGQLAGSPVVVSEFSREDLNDDGVFGGAIDDAGMISYFNRDGFIIGDRREVRIARSDQLYIESDQVVWVASQRLDFQRWFNGADQVLGTQVVNVR